MGAGTAGMLKEPLGMQREPSRCCRSPQDAAGDPGMLQEPQNAAGAPGMLWESPGCWQLAGRGEQERALSALESILHPTAPCLISLGCSPNCPWSAGQLVSVPIPLS